MNMKIRFQNYKCYCAFCWFLWFFFHFHYVLQRFWMHFCSNAAQKLLRRPSESWSSPGCCLRARRMCAALFPADTPSLLAPRLENEQDSITSSTFQGTQTPNTTDKPQVFNIFEPWSKALRLQLQIRQESCNEHIVAPGLPDAPSSGHFFPWVRWCQNIKRTQTYIYIDRKSVV